MTSTADSLTLQVLLWYMRSFLALIPGLLTPAFVACSTASDKDFIAARTRQCEIYKPETQLSGRAWCLQGSYIWSRTVSTVDISLYRNSAIVSTVHALHIPSIKLITTWNHRFQSHVMCLSISIKLLH